MVGLILTMALWLFQMGVALGFLFIALLIASLVFLAPMVMFLGLLNLLDYMDDDDYKKKRKF